MQVRKRNKIFFKLAKFNLIDSLRTDSDDFCQHLLNSDSKGFCQSNDVNFLYPYNMYQTSDVNLELLYFSVTGAGDMWPQHSDTCFTNISNSSTYTSTLDK